MLEEVSPQHPCQQFHNALEIRLSGGYGMFFDNIDMALGLGVDGDHHVFLCHECAHKACIRLPWLNRLIDPMGSHSHRQDYWDANPEHEGWDKEGINA